jgi:hypothetical protein
MDDPAVPSTKKRGRPKGGRGRGRGKSKGLVVKKHKGIDRNKKQAENIAEPNINYNDLSSSEVDAEDVETSNIAPNIVVEEDEESDSDIEHGDDDEDGVIDAGDADGLVEFIEERNEPVFQTDIIQRLAIGYMFFKKFGAPENHQEWRDKKIRPKIRRAFDMPPGARIDHILNDVVACVGSMCHTIERTDRQGYPNC